MIHQERAASGEADVIARRAGCQPPALPGSGTRAHQTPVWEDLYRAISPEEQRVLVSLAERQGVLYAHQLPVRPNGTAADTSHQPLGRILGGDVAELQPLFADAVDVGDRELDAVQREAVAKALATPDIFLLQGRPGSGKSRVVAEIITRAAAQGQRVLLLAATAAAIDRVLEWVICRDVVFPVRCVGHDEQLAALPATIRGLTLSERARALNLHALASARQQADADEQRARRLRQDEPLWSRLEELARQWEIVEREFQALQSQRSRLAVEVVEPADAPESAANDGFARVLRELTRAHNEAALHAEKRLADLRGQMEAGEQQQKAADVELEALQGLVEAKQQRRWWTGAWWRVTIQGNDIMVRWARLQERRQQIQRDVDAAQGQLAAAERQREEAKKAFTAQRAELLDAEIARRQADLEDREAVLCQQRHVLQQKWQDACQSLASESPRPTAMTAQAVQEARADSCRQAEQAAAQHAFALQWIAYLEQTPHALTPRLPGYVNLVAATIKALPRDEHFGDQATATALLPDFDLLVLEEADQVAEADFLQAARRGRHCVLVGEPEWPQQTPSRPLRDGALAREHKSAPSGLRGRSATAGRSSPFQRFWQLLHCDPRQLPYAWIREANRLCCRLRRVASDRRQWITTEHVADFPEIELRILTVPGSRPVLAEIVFPPTFSVDRAKRYIFEELEELAVQASGSALHWSAEADRLVVRLAERDLAHGLTIDLVPGIREILGTAFPEGNGSLTPATDFETCCLQFDRTAGWDRPRATKWLQQHLGLRDLGRTACLDTCYRMETGLSAFVSDLLFAEASNRDQALRIQQVERNGQSGSVEFVPVPAGRQSTAAQTPGNGGGRRGLGTARPGARSAVPSHKGGAGLELDLADLRQQDRLPADLRSHLPNEGFVNYPEAQAVVAALADLVKETGLGELGGDHELIARQPAVAVVALYSAQAELIRRLIRQDPRLAPLDRVVEIGVPAAFRQREATVVLLSLTRSHTHRAVAFGDGPQMLALAMTRARAKLVVFGDPGTLLRRSQWEGPLEHLDEETAARERQLIARLVHCLPGCGSSTQAVHSQI